MTKRAFREAKRLEPIGAAGIAACQALVAAKSLGKVNEVAVDLFSASAIVAVHKALNAENRAKLEALPVVRAADVCFKLINQHQGGSGA